MISFKFGIESSTILALATHLWNLYQTNEIKSFNLSGAQIVHKAWAVSMTTELCFLLDNTSEISRTLLKEIDEEGHLPNVFSSKYFYLGLNLYMAYNQFKILKEFVLDPSVQLAIHEASIQVEALPNIPEAEVQTYVEAYSVEQTGNDIRPHMD